MPWAKIDDDAPSHPKMFRAGCEAFGFWVAGNCYCNRRLTDGFIATDELPLIFPGMPRSRTLAAVERLVEVGLWEREATGWRVHDFLAYNPSREAVRAEREAAKARKNRWKERRSGTRPEQRSERAENAVRNGGKNDAHARAATRPDPTHTPYPRDAARSDPPQTGSRFPPELFNPDCPPEERVDHGRRRVVDWAGKCVSSAYLAEHPDLREYPAVDERGTPRQCPHHRALVDAP